MQPMQTFVCSTYKLELMANGTVSEQENYF